MANRLTALLFKVLAVSCFVGGLMFGGSAFAETETQALGRYQIEPDGDGFVRLDTQTGTLTYCERDDRVWRCEVIADSRSDDDERLVALQRRLAELDADIAVMAERLDAIEGDEAPVPAPLVEPERSLEEQERELDEALSFAERMMQRFFDMIRDFKDEVPPQQI